MSWADSLLALGASALADVVMLTNIRNIVTNKAILPGTEIISKYTISMNYLKKMSMFTQISWDEKRNETDRNKNPSW